MTLSVTASACTYTGDGSTQIFDVKSGSEGIYFETASELTVTLRSGDTITPQTISTHYTVSGAGSATGTVTFLTAPADDVEVRIERNTAKTQTLSLTQAGAFSPPAIMSAFDKLTRITQDLSRGVSSGSDSGTYNGHPLTLDPSGDAWDAESHIISNVTDGALPNDAVNYSQLLAVSLDAGQWALGNQTAVAGSAMGITYLLESNTVHTAREEGGIWSGRVSSFAAISKAFSSSTPNDSGSPCATLFAYAVNNGAAGDVCALIADSAAFANSTTVFGANIIARTQTALTGVKAVGLEIDVEPAAGVTLAAGSIGLAINMFSTACPGPAIQTGGVSSGTFANGVVLYGIASTGAGFTAGSGETMGSLVNTGVCTYNHAAIVVSNQHKIRLTGTASAHAYIWNDGSNNVRIVNGAGAIIVRNNADSASLVVIDNSGNLDLQSAGTLTMRGASSGAITFQAQAAAGTYNFNWPTTAGTSGQVLLSGGGSAAPMTWSSTPSLSTLLLSGGSADAVSLTVRQTSAGTPASNIFAVQDNGGSINYLAIDPSGAMLVKGPSAATTIVYDTTSSSAVVQQLFRDAGTDKFYLRKRTDNDFDFVDASAVTIWHAKAGGTMGIGIAAITSSWLKLAAGTTGKAQINFPSSTAPTSPNDGDFWFDGTNFKARVAGATKTFTII